MQQHGSNYFIRRHKPTTTRPTPINPPTLTFGVGSKINFFRTWSCCMSNQMESNKYSNMVANILSADLTPEPWVASKGQNLPFSEHGHVAFQIYLNHECSNMVANILHADPLSPTLEVESKGSKVNFFQKMVMLHIKFSGITSASTGKQIFCPQQFPTPTSADFWGQKLYIFQTMIMQHIKLKGIANAARW